MTNRFRLDFTPHLGFPTPETPLFLELVGSAAPEAQIAFAAVQGFRRIQDPFTASRSETDQALIGAAARDAGLDLGCFVFATMERAMQPIWSATTPAERAALDAELDAAVKIGQRIGSRHIGVLTGFDPARSRSEQFHAMTANLARLGDRAAEAGMMLCVEAVNAHRLPRTLLHHFADAIDIVRAAGHPAVRLIFDTAHIQAMDGDILGNLDRGWDFIELIQLADHPGRVEPGAGELNFVHLIDEIENRRFSGPVELEHRWADANADCQARYLQWLGRWSSSEDRNTHVDVAT